MLCAPRLDAVISQLMRRSLPEQSRVSGGELLARYVSVWQAVVDVWVGIDTTA
jgi:hypothetical protein